MKFLIIFLFSFLIISLVSFDAFAASPNEPSAPLNLQVISVGDGTVTLTWEKPLFWGLNGDDIIDYQIEYVPDAYFNKIPATIFKDGTSTSLTGIVTGLTNDKLYNFNLKAINSWGAGKYTDTAYGTPKGSSSSPNIILLPVTDSTENKNGGGCNDCVPPTIGVIDSIRFVDYGLVLNDVQFQADLFKNHMDMQYTILGVENHLEVKVYENLGAYNIDFIQFGIVPEIGSSLNIFEPRLEIDIKNTAHDIENPGLEGVELFDKNGIISKYRVDVSLVECMEGFTQDCLKLDIYWTFAKIPENKVLAIGGWDNDKNAFTNYFNDGITVTDPNYVEPTSEESYKYTCNDPLLHTLMNGGDRKNCHWRALHMGWLYQ